MKRIIILLMAAVMLIGAAGLAGAAVEFKASGHMHMNFALMDNSGADDALFDADKPEDNFFAAQRFRPKLTMSADNVTAVFETQQEAAWGSNWPVGDHPDLDIRIRQAYIDFKLPGTPVSLKVGYQQLNLPSIWGHPVFEARVGGAVATIPFNDQIALTAFWARPIDKKTFAGVGGNSNDITLDSKSHNSDDLFGVMLPMNLGNAKATPYFVYGRFGNGTVLDNTTDDVRLDGVTDMLLIGGVNVEVIPMDGLSVKVDAIATNYSSDINDADTGLGFMVAAAIDYELPWGAPGVFVWYATGADKDGEGAFYSIMTDGFAPTSWGTAGTASLGYDSQISLDGVSTAAIGLQIADMSFIDDLQHTVRVAYIMGTSDNSSLGWTTDDFFIEANLDSTWSIYENLSAVLELGAIIPDVDGAGQPNDPALKAQLSLCFNF